MSLIVQKFGGSSVADAHHLLNVAKTITDLYSKNNDVIVVVSAQGNTTDNLIKSAYNINSSPSKRELDALLSAGEQISSALLAITIEKLGFPAISLTGWQAGFHTDSSYGNAEIINIITDRVKHELNRKNIVIIAGFQGINANNDITTFGRGGSDTSAVAIAAAVNADVCKIYTDVDGVYTCDPRIVASAKKLKTISYKEMFELSYYGAQVLNERSISTAQKNNVEIEVLSSMLNNPKGTIVKQISSNNINCISGIAVLNDIVKITITDLYNNQEFKKAIFEKLEKSEIHVDALLKPIGKKDKNSLVFTVSKEKLNETVKILEEFIPCENKAQIFYDKDKSEISVINISENININIASIMFETLSELKINIEMVACNNKRVSIIIPSHDMSNATNAIHSKFFEEDNLI